MSLKPKLCINSQCNNIIYVQDYFMHMGIQCEECIERRRKLYEEIKANEALDLECQTSPETLR